MALSFVGCDYVKSLWHKAEAGSCKAIVLLADQAKNQLVSRYDAKDPACIDRLALVKKCRPDPTLKTEGFSIGGGSIDTCKEIADQAAHIMAADVAKKCQANEDKIYKDMKNVKELCNALVALGFFK